MPDSRNLDSALLIEVDARVVNFVIAAVVHVVAAFSKFGDRHSIIKVELATAFLHPHRLHFEAHLLAVEQRELRGAD